jgi:hypothetical protein
MSNKPREEEASLNATICVVYYRRVVLARTLRIVALFETGVGEEEYNTNKSIAAVGRARQIMPC